MKVMISKKEVEHVALLARLELSEEEKEMYTQQLGSILEYINKLNELDTENVEPTAHVLPMRNVFREDQSRTWLDNETALANAPSKQDGYFKVPRIV
ncbi:glutamyl-tRNA(Gln) amidotransferase subunit C [Calderihabitans maritimus]|uniref:Aspartyl/glutamyl-tRNA(Asn/Gln) amidotransferase subunit C n=2 Tax=Calderihabitans maritimus TaxID=1246530 RepID=A0A1Z5HPZ7_9FIRM|nr:glutamyl-tRNA(Gln) amidotransferase subunit C [Calderihabitans maritimus]